jgi:hypothetical protein
MVCLIVVFNGLSQTTTFNYTGAVQTYTVPSGVSVIQIEAKGAQGGGSFGGNGGQAIGTFSVTPGAVLQVYVGGKPSAQLGAGGFNGGGAVLVLPCTGGDGWPGGGASDVRTTASLANRMIVAGGGGGQGWSNGVGGAGGGTTGGDGIGIWTPGTNGKGATAIAGGAGGFYSGNGGSSPSGTFGMGGNGSPVDTYCAGGAGGGGWYGGGGGYVSSGGGGSSYISYPGTTNASTASGVQTGNGIVIITVICSSINAVVSASTVCEDESITLSASSSNGGTISWNNGVLNGVPFTPASTGTITYTATSSNINDCGFTANITVNALPLVDAGTDVEVCDGESAVLTATGTGTFTWDNSVNQSMPFTPTATTTYTVTADNGNCTATDEVMVTVNNYPTVNAGTDEEICNGESIALTATGTGTFSWDNSINQAMPFTPTVTTTYTVTADNGNCTATDEVTVTVHDLPTVDAGTDVEICNGESVALTATGTGTFSWDNSVSQAMPFTPTVTTTYTVTADNGDCTATDEVTVTVHNLPTVDAGTNQTICLGESVVLTAVGTGAFAWDNSVNQAMPFTPTVTTTYTVTADNGDCIATDQVTVNVDAVPTATVNLSGVATLNAAPAAQTYQWINCSTGTAISGETSGTYTATANGSYAVVLTNSAGCSDTSSCVSVTSLGLSENDVLEGISFSPNPTSGLVVISMLESMTSGTLTVYDMQGKLVLETMTVQNGSSFDLSHVQSGVYMIHIETANSTGMSRMVKN